MSSTVSIFRTGIKCPYFVNLSTTTRIVSYYVMFPGSVDFSKLVIKSIVTVCYGLWGISIL